MSKRVVRVIAAIVLTLTAGGTGYAIGESNETRIPSQTIAVPAPGSTRIVYSLEKKQNDKELIALIDAAREYIYFAIYTFTLPSIAEALVAAHERGVVVRGVMDFEQSKSSYSAPIVETLTTAGIPIVGEIHESGNGIMHIKALVTESAYAIGSYNWTISATTLNDEILEIGTDEAMRQAYETIIKKLFTAYSENRITAGAAVQKSVGTIEYAKAGEYIGSHASVTGILERVYISSSGTVFLDFCKNYRTCPFTGVIFADDAKKFSDLSRYEGKSVMLTGKIRAYEGRAEIILSDPKQLSL